MMRRTRNDGRVFAATYAMRRAGEAPRDDGAVDLFVLGPTPESCELSTYEVEGETWELDARGSLEIPSQGFGSGPLRPTRWGNKPGSGAPWAEARHALVAAPIAPRNMMGWFSGCASLRSIDGFELVDTSHVTDMRDLFCGCFELRSVDLSRCNTSRVRSMNDMFCACENLRELDLSHFDTSRVMGMSGMFLACLRLERVDLSGFDTSRVTNLRMMFAACPRLGCVDLSGFRTSRVTNMEFMFATDSSLTSLDLSSFNMLRVRRTVGMLAGCSGLRQISLGALDLSRISPEDSAMMFGEKGSVFGRAEERIRRAGRIRSMTLRIADANHLTLAKGEEVLV